MREQFTFYRSFFAAISAISSKRDKLSLYESITRYALNGEEIAMTETAKALFLLIKPTLDAAAKKSEGRKNRIRQEQDADKIPSRPEQDTVKEKEKERENKREKESLYIGDNAEKKQDTIKTEPPVKRFTKPTVEEIAAYCQERQNGVDPQRFYDFYESKGWKIGKTPMKDWRAAVRTWEQKRRDDNAQMGRTDIQGTHEWGVKSVDLDGADAGGTSDCRGI